MTRSGYLASTAAYLILTAAVLVTTLVASWSAERQLALSHRLHRVQGREWCLGAESLARGSQLAIGRWRIARSADGSVSASGPAGTYRIDAHGLESWRSGTGGGL